MILKCSCYNGAHLPSGRAGQYYLRAIYYNPVVGRFLQEDTYRGDGLKPYAYCANNPDDTLVKQVSNEGGTYSKNNRLALGLSDYLDDFASENNLGMFELPFDIANDMSGEYYKPS